MVVAVLIMLALLFVQTDTGTERVLRYAAKNLIPLDATTIEFESATGNPLSTLALSGVRLKNDDGDTLIEAESLSIEYRVGTLASQNIQIGFVKLINPVIRTRQGADGTWDLQNIFISNPDAVPPNVAIERLEILNGTVFAIPNAAPEGEQVEARRLNLVSRDISIGSQFSFVSDVLTADITSWATPGPTSVYFDGDIVDSRVSLDSLSINSDRSDMVAKGTVDTSTILQPGDGTTDLSLEARPLHLSDMTAFLPDVDPTVSMEGHVTMQAKTPALELDGHVEFSDGGILDVEGLVGHSNSGLRTYNFNGSASGLKLSSFGSSLPGDPLSAQVTGQLVGSSNDSLSGEIEVTSTSPFNHEGLTVLPSTLTAALTTGEAAIGGTINSTNGRVNLSGTVRPFDRVPGYDLRAGIDNLSVASVVAAIPRPLSGKVVVRGVGIVPDSLTATIDVELDAFRINNLDVSRLDINSTVTNGTAIVDGSASTNTGDVKAGARVSFIDGITMIVDEIRTTSFDLAAAAGDTSFSSVTGSGSGTLEIESGLLTGVSAVFNADALDYDDLEFDKMALRVDSESDYITGTVDAGFDGSSVVVSGRAHQNENGIQFESANAQFAGLNLAHFVTNLDSTALFGSADIVARNIGANSADWKLSLDSSSVNDIVISSGDAHGRYLSDSTTFTIDFTTSAGAVAGDGVAWLEGFTPSSFGLHDIVFASLDPMKFTGQTGSTTDLNGKLSSFVDLSGAGTSTTTRIELDSSVFNGIVINDAILESDIRNGVGPVTGSAQFGSGSLALDSRVDISGDTPAFTGELNLVEFPIGELIFSDTLSSALTAVATVDGSGSNINDADFSFSVLGQDSHYGLARLQSLDLAGALRHGVLQLEAAELESNVITASAGGTLGLWSDSSSSSFEVNATLVDARPINSFLKREFDVIGNGIFLATVDGPRGEEVFVVDTDLQSLVYGDFRAGGLTASISGSIDDSVSFESLTSSTTVEHFSTPSVTVRRTDFDIGLADDTLRFDVFSTIDSRRNGSMHGLVDTGDDERILLVEDIALKFDDDVWELLQPTTIAYQDFYEIRNMLIFTDDQQIALDGVIDLDGDQSLLLTVEEFRMGAVADLLGFTGLDGTVNGYLDLTGPAHAPIMQGDLLSTVESFGKSYGDLNLVLAYDSLKLNVDATLTNEDGSTFTVDGHIPVNLRLAPSEGQTETGIRVAAGQAQLSTTVDLDVKSDGFSLDWILPFLDPEMYSDIGGRVTGEVKVTGTVSDPVMDGTATLNNGHIGLVLFGLVYQGINGDFGFDGQTINLEHVQVESGGGELIALGTVSLSQLNLGNFDISLSAEDFLAVDNDEYKGSVIADLQVSGTTDEPYISGYTQVVSGEMFLNGEYEEFEAVSLTQDDLLEVERVFGIRVSESDTSTFDFYKALALDINLELERNMWLRSDASPEMDIQFTGDLDMRKVKDGEMQIFGNIDVIPDRSRITELGKRFRIVNGVLTFNGPATDPELNIEAHHTIRSSRTGSEDVTIILVVRGKLDDLEEAPLDSDPEMELADILSYLAFGRPAKETLQFSGAGGENLAKDIALGQATGYLEGLAGSELGFDVFEIEQQDFETRLTAGKYLTQRLFVSVSQPISFNGQASELTDDSIREITAEFELIQNLLLKLTQRESLKFDLLWQYAY